MFPESIQKQHNIYLCKFGTGFIGKLYISLQVFHYSFVNVAIIAVKKLKFTTI